MGVQIVMDGSGDTRHAFDASDSTSLAEAEQRFQKLNRAGFRAVALGTHGSAGELLDRFDPEVEQTLFIPQLKGG